MLILATILAIFVYGMIAAMLGTILPELSERFQLSPSQNGTIASAQALGLILASLGVGPLLDNEGQKLGMVLGLAFISVALFALPRSPGFRTILLLLFLLGVGGGRARGCHAPGWLGDRSSPRRPRRRSTGPGPAALSPASTT